MSNKHLLTLKGVHILLLIGFLMCFQLVPAQHLIQYVQPLAGTAPSTTLAAFKHSEAGSEKNANTIPSVGLPFGMTQFTPQTRFTENKCIPPYFYTDSLFTGIRATHWLSGSCTQDYGSFTVMPVVGELKTMPTDYSTIFHHDNETTTPAYYKLKIPQKNLVIEVTPTLRCAIIRFTLLQADSLHLLITPNSDFGTSTININQGLQEITGTNTVHRIYQGWGNKAGFDGCFYLKTDKEFIHSGTYVNGSVLGKKNIANQKNAGGFISYYLKKGESLEVSIGTSFTSVSGAIKNYVSEINNHKFSQIRLLAERQWEQALGQIKVETNDTKLKRIFYTAMYHAMQHPRLMSDTDGSYPRFSGNYEIEKITGDNYYDDFSMWDIYRAQLPLIELLQPNMANQFVKSLILKGKQGGWLPIFPCWNNYTAAMIGDHSTVFIASAYNKGIRNYDIAEAYSLTRKNAFDSPATFLEYKNGMGRRALDSYIKYGYIPMEDSVQEAFHKKEQVSRTLEYAYDDYALSTIAKAMNHNQDYTKLNKRALNYKNIFDKSVGMMRGRYINGTWAENFNADIRESYITEGTPRQYSFYVPHDIKGLSVLMGGTKKFEAALDSLFLKGEYWHGNEPGHQIPFLYNYTSSPYKTHKIVRNILTEEYSDGPGGLSGNDDAGQMSAWYIFASIGIYPVNPVSGEYVITSPLFDKISIKVNKNSYFRVICKKQSVKSVYIKTVKLNGVLLTKNFITHKDIRKGGVIEFTLSDQPTNWGNKSIARPSSLTAF